MKMKNVSIIMYSHRDYSDTWKMFAGQIDKYFPKDIQRFIFTSEDASNVGILEINDLYDDWKLVEYEDNIAYNNKVLSCLEKIDTEFCLYHQEDMPLYDKPNFEAMESFLPEISSGNIDFVKLIKGGLTNDIPYNFLKSPYLFKIPQDAEYLYANQPTIWKTSRLKEIFRNTFSPSIREFELYAQGTCRSLDIKGCYTYNNEPKRGEMHWDSSIYPYVATAIVKGKWNTSQYSKELNFLFKDYDIDPSIRGEI